MASEITHIDNEVLYQVMRQLYSTTDQLIDRLAPEGWVDSPFHFPFEVVYGEREALYETYDTVAVAYKSKFGALSERYILKNRDEIDSTTCAKNIYSAETELIYLIEYALFRLATNGLFYKADQKETYYFIDDLDLEEQSYLLGIELELDSVLTINMPHPTAAREDILPFIDLSVLYAIIINAFAAQGYDWRYRNEDLINLWFIYKINAQRNNKHNKLQKCDYLETIKQLLIDFEKALPPDEVIGYTLNYDKLPIGYPPTIEDIKALTV